jgi:hypothetical protein
MDRKFTPTTFLVWSGLLIWAADFLLIYVIEAIACAKGFADAVILGLRVIPLTTLICSAAAVIATGLILRRCMRQAQAAQADERTQFTLFITGATGALALLAIVWTALPGLLLRTGCS